MFKILYNIIIFLTFFTSLHSQDTNTKNLFEQHIEFLASDSLEGRMTGTEGAKIAQSYIINEFESIGLSPLGDKAEWTQAFQFKTGKETPLQNNQLTFSGKKFSKQLTPNKDYYILNHSIDTHIKGEVIDAGYGIIAPNLNHNDYLKINKNRSKSKIFVIRDGHPDMNNPHSDFIEYADYNSKIDNAKKYGAQAVIFLIGKNDNLEEITKKYDLTVTSGSFPVLIFGEYDNYLNTNKLRCEADIKVTPTYTTGHNVVGFIDNNKTNTIVIGAHYDHLGYGEHGSLHTGSKEIHNGADDNASGVALVIELARQLKADSLVDNNYLFICFSGEELGLYGSNFFTKNPTFPLEQGNYMLNFDMIGRLDTVSNTLVINGTGTSPAWEVLEEMSSDEVSIKMNPSGIGPSDHTQFYLNDIPALHFFTGAHEDYHKPSDDEEKINYEGLMTINQLVMDLIRDLNEEGKIVFTQTKEDEQEKAPRFTVGLGVIPDYLFDGEGMRIDGVREGKVASKAGLLKGDIVIGLGEVEVVDMMTYMKALSLFSVGDSTTVKVKRNEDIINKEITFF